MQDEVTINHFIRQLRSRIQDREKEFLQAIRAIERSQSARGLLNSGSTVSKVLSQLKIDFKAQTEEALQYLGKAFDRTDLERQELFQTTAWELRQSSIAFKSIVPRQRLAALSPGIERVIEGAFEELDSALELRLEEFRVGLHDAAPRRNAPSLPLSIPASDRYVSLVDNERQDLNADLELLRESVQASNEATEEQRLVALSEIAAFEATIVQPRVSTDLIQRFIDRVLNWMTSVFSKALIGEVAKRLVNALMALLKP